MCRPQPQDVCARLAVPMSLFPGHHLYVKDHASHSLYILDEGGVGSCLAARFLSLRAPGGTAAKQGCCQRLELRCRNNPALWPGTWAGGWRLAHAAPQGRGARSFLPAGRMSASSGPGWSDAVFSGPAVLNLSSLFAAHVPECAHHSQTVTAESGCHLWRVDCAMFERELLHRHTSILQELCQMQLQASLQHVALQHVLPSCSHCPCFVQAGQLPLRSASLTPQNPPPLTAVTPPALQRTKELLQCGSDLGWGTQEPLKRESAALGRLQALAAGLEKHLATLAAAAEQQQKQVL